MLCWAKSDEEVASVGAGEDCQRWGVVNCRVAGAVATWLLNPACEALAAGQELHNAIEKRPMFVQRFELASPLPESDDNFTRLLGLLVAGWATVPTIPKPLVYVADDAVWDTVSPAWVAPPWLIARVFGDEIGTKLDPASFCNAIWLQFGRIKQDIKARNVHMPNAVIMTCAIASIANYMSYSRTGDTLADWPPFGLAKRNAKAEAKRLRKTLIADMKTHEANPVIVPEQRRTSRRRKSISAPSTESLQRTTQFALLASIVGTAANATLKALRKDRGKYGHQ